MRKYLVFILSFTLVVLIAAPVLGVTFSNPFGEEGPQEIVSLFSQVINFLFNLAIFLCAIIIVYAGFLFVTSAGNQQKLQTAQKALIWALVGLVVVLIANYVPGIIKDVLGL
jgi:predicted membrane protein